MSQEPFRLAFGGMHTIEFTVKYSNRKTIGINVKPPDVISVTAPKGIDEATILKMDL